MQKKEIVLIGAGRFGTALVNYLYQLTKYTLIVVDKDEKKLSALREKIDAGLIGDATTDNFFRDNGLLEADVYVIGIGEDMQNSLLIAATLKERVKGRVIAKTSNISHTKILNRLGVIDTINSELASAKSATMKIINPMITDKYAKISEIDAGMSFVRTTPLPEWVGKQVKDIEMPKETSLALIYKNNNAHIVNGLTPLNDGDEVVIVGSNKELFKLIQAK